MASIDPFTRRRLPDVAERFRRTRDSYDRAARLMWRGALSTFDDGEIDVLRRSGFLSQADEDHLRALGRTPRV